MQLTTIKTILFLSFHLGDPKEHQKVQKIYFGAEIDFLRVILIPGRGERKERREEGVRGRAKGRKRRKEKEGRRRKERKGKNKERKRESTFVALSISLIFASKYLPTNTEFLICFRERDCISAEERATKKKKKKKGSVRRDS